MSAAPQLDPSDVAPITWFQSLTDTTALCKDTIWSDLFSDFSKPQKFTGRGWSPAEFHPPERKLENVERVHALVLDYDGNVSIDEMLTALAGYQCHIHTTRSHTPECPRFRVVLPLSRSVTPKEYESLWAGAAERWPGLDKSPKDPSRFWFVPGTDSEHFLAFTLDGEKLNPGSLRASPPPVRAFPRECDTALADRARAYIEKMPPAVSGSGGHTATFNVARKLVQDFGLDDQSALELLRAYNQRCIPPWSEKELRHKVDQARDKATVSNPVQDRPRDDVAGARKPWSSDAEQAGNAWPDLIPFDDVGRLPRFPVDALPQTLRDWVEAEATATQTPPELAAAIVIAVLSTIAAKHFDVQVKPGWVEPLSLYMLAAMLPGERKSQVFKDASKRLREWEKARADAMKAAIAAAVTARTIKEKRLDALITKAARGDEKSASAGQEAQELAIELAESHIPVAPLLSVDDVTPEKLSSLMYEHGGRMAVMSAEGGIFDTIAGRYANGIPNIEVLLKGHAGDDLRVDRVNRAPLHIQSPTLTMCICAQPEVLQGLTSKPTFAGRGLLARFLYVLPTSLMGSRDVAPPPVPGGVTAAYEKLVNSLLHKTDRERKQREIAAERLTLSAEAVDGVHAFMRRIEVQLGPGGDLEQIRDWGAKASGALVRIAALLHLAGSSESSESFEQGVVSRRDLDESEKILLFFLSHSMAAFRVMGMDSTLANARKLLNWIQKNHFDTFSKRDAQQKNRALFKTASDLDPVLKTLEEHGYIRRAKSPATGGRPSLTFEVNPSAQKPQKPQKGSAS